NLPLPYATMMPPCYRNTELPPASCNLILLRTLAWLTYGGAVSFDEYGIHIAVLYIHYYALILMLGMVVGAWLTARRARANGLDENHVWDGLLWAIIPGLIGARLYHVLTPSPASGL